MQPCEVVIVVVASGRFALGSFRSGTVAEAKRSLMEMAAVAGTFAEAELVVPVNAEQSEFPADILVVTP